MGHTGGGAGPGEVIVSVALEQAMCSSLGAGLVTSQRSNEVHLKLCTEQTNNICPVFVILLTSFLWKLLPWLSPDLVNMARRKVSRWERRQSRKPSSSGITTTSTMMLRPADSE